jgi:predicted amidohydrolase YtcJ
MMKNKMKKSSLEKKKMGLFVCASVNALSAGDYAKVYSRGRSLELLHVLRRGSLREGKHADFVTY